MIAYLIAALITTVPLSFVIMKLNDDKVKQDVRDFGEREAERKALQRAQEFDKF